MKKTGSEIEADVFAILRASALKTTIAGQIYKEDMRPINATTEDAVVSFMTGLDGQIQAGVVTINAFVPMTDIGGGTLAKNTTRCKQLEMLMQSIVSGLKPDEYRFSLDTIIKTFKVEGSNQHFVNTKLKFERTSF